MVTTRVDLTLADFAQELGSMSEDMEKAVIKGLRSASAQGVSVVVEKINKTRPYPPIDTGELARSVESTTLPRGGRISVDAPHAAIIETGTRPFWPPLQPLMDWAMRKGIAEDEDEAEDIARAIQKKFAFVGMEPRRYFRRSMPKIRKLVVKEVESELKTMWKVRARKPRKRRSRKRK